MPTKPTTPATATAAPTAAAVVITIRRLVRSTSMPRWNASASPSSRPLSARIEPGQDEHHQQRERQDRRHLRPAGPGQAAEHPQRQVAQLAVVAGEGDEPHQRGAERAERDAGEQQGAGCELALPRRRSRPGWRWWRRRRGRPRRGARRRRTPWPRVRPDRCRARSSPPPRARRRTRRRPGRDRPADCGTCPASWRPTRRAPRRRTGRAAAAAGGCRRARAARGRRPRRPGR